MQVLESAALRDWWDRCRWRLVAIVAIPLALYGAWRL